MLQQIDWLQHSSIMCDRQPAFSAKECYDSQVLVNIFSPEPGLILLHFTAPSVLYAVVSHVLTQFYQQNCSIFQLQQLRRCTNKISSLDAISLVEILSIRLQQHNSNALVLLCSFTSCLPSAKKYITDECFIICFLTAKFKFLESFLLVNLASFILLFIFFDLPIICYFAAQVGESFNIFQALGISSQPLFHACFLIIVSFRRSLSFLSASSLVGRHLQPRLLQSAVCMSVLPEPSLTGMLQFVSYFHKHITESDYQNRLAPTVTSRSSTLFTYGTKLSI